MLQAIIDIGSNSIRLAIYKIENEKVELLMNKKEIARLAAYVVNGFMNSEGIEKACYVLKDFKNLLDNLQINNVIAFAKLLCEPRLLNALLFQYLFDSIHR